MSAIHHLLAAPLLLAVPALLGACQGSAPERPNLLLVSIDTLRADHLSAWGYARETSPRIDALCARGVRCVDAVSTTSWTMPAHLSMLTGQSISAHGMCDDRLLDLVGSGQLGELPLRGTLLAELLKRRGYATAGFYSWIYLEPRFGFDAGFDTYERIGHSAYSHPEWRVRFQDLRRRGAAGDEAARAELATWMEEQPSIFDEQRPTSHETVDAAVAWLDAQEGEDPWFLFVHLFDVHDAYVPPAPYDSMFDPGYEGPIDGRNVTSPQSPVTADMDPRDLAHLIALYDGEIAWVDSQVGRLLDHLEALGVSDDTLVVLTSDHGEEFYEHGQKTHRNSLHTESVHVPLVFSLPGRLPADRVVTGPTGLVDIVPTVCDLLDIPPPPSVSGRSLAAVLRGEEANAAAVYTSLLNVFPPEGGPPTRHVGVHRGGDHALFMRAPGEAALDLDAVRPGLQRCRDHALPRSVNFAALSEADILELEAGGYLGRDGDVEGASTEGERLCVDGCVWPAG